MLRRSTSGSLGFSIVGGQEEVNCNQSFFIRSIVEGTPAYNDGRIRYYIVQEYSYITGEYSYVTEEYSYITEEYFYIIEEYFYILGGVALCFIGGLCGPSHWGSVTGTMALVPGHFLSAVALTDNGKHKGG